MVAARAARTGAAGFLMKGKAGRLTPGARAAYSR